MNPNPAAHFPHLSKLNNEQLTSALLRSAAIRGEGGILVDAQGGVRPVWMRVTLGTARLTISPAPVAEAIQPPA